MTKKCKYHCDYGDGENCHYKGEGEGDCMFNRGTRSMPDREKVIKLIEEEISVCESVNQCYRTIDLPALRDILALLKEQEDLGTELTNAVELIHKKNERIEKLLKEQERKTGSWDYGTQCSVCKGTIIPPKDRKIRVNFCPWCGADMRNSYEQEGR